MRRLQLGLLLGVVMVLTTVGWNYFDARRANRSVRLAEPIQIPSHLDAQATRWTWSQSTGNRRRVEGSAARIRQTKDTGVLDLDDVELRIFHEDTKSFDLVVTSNALFDSREGKLYSKAPVTLTLGLFEKLDTSGDKSPTVIRSTDVTFDSKHGTCSTDQPTEYEFNGGRGRSVGAFYDSMQGLLHMRSDVYLERFPEHTEDLLAKVWTSELIYHEHTGYVELKGGVLLERGQQKMQSAEAMIFLDQGLVRRIEAHQAHGFDRQPSRTINFRADWFEALYTDGLLERASGANPDEIESITESSVTQVNGDRIDLHYTAEPGKKESRLREMYSRDKARIELRPASRTGPTNLHRVSADVIHLVMHKDSKNVERIETLTSGKLEILPRDTLHPRRVLRADRMTAYYTTGSHMERLRASGHVALENHTSTKSGSPEKGELLRSWSEELEARFAPDFGALEWINQWINFRFERGRRRGQSDKAHLVPGKNELILETSARVWDTENNISAHRIVLNDRTGDLLAETAITSRYQPEESTAAQQVGSLFTPSQPVFAIADYMAFREKKGEVEYTGGARLWQGRDRIEANRITILRHEGNLFAEGGVKSYLRAGENRQKPEAHQKFSGSLMLIQSDSLLYEAANQRALYRGRTTFQRGTLLVRSENIDVSFTSTQNGDTLTLEEAVAHGDVMIVEESADGSSVRKGYGREAVYDPTASVARLKGVPARVIDEVGNETGGPELTYHLNDDRLLVQGKKGDRAYSLRRRNQP